MRIGRRRFWVVTAAALAVGCSHEEEKKVTPLVEVKIDIVKTADLVERIRVPGTLWPLAQAGVAAKISGPIRQLRVRKGSPVQKDEVLAVLENGDVTAARNEARGALKEAEASLARLSAGALPGDVERAQAEVSTAKSKLETAQKIYDRRKTLVDQGAIPTRELLTAESDLTAARNAYAVAQKNLDLLQSQTRQRDIDIARSKVDQALARLAQAEAQVGFTEIRSPLNGVVTDQWMYPGDMAKPDAPIVTVMDLSKVIVRAQVPEAQAAKLRRGQEAEFEPQDQPDKKAAGRISVISAAVDKAARTVEVWVEIENPKQQLRAGSYGRLAIATEQLAGVVAVPRAAIVMEEGSSEGAVSVVDEKNIAHQRKVKTGVEDNGVLQIVDGLKPGEKIVVEGNYGLPDNAEVKPK